MHNSIAVLSFRSLKTKIKDYIESLSECLHAFSYLYLSAML